MVSGYIADVVITLPVAVSREQSDDADVIGDGRVTSHICAHDPAGGLVPQPD